MQKSERKSKKMKERSAFWA